VIGFPSPKNWWDRWFGYLTLYYAANGGAPYLDLENGEVLFDNEAGYGVAAFMDEMFANGWAPTDPELVDPLQSGVVAGYVMGPSLTSGMSSRLRRCRMITQRMPQFTPSPTLRV
jgi:ABC-type glycerol-3-phosphate transport system substrate-binding protein